MTSWNHALVLGLAAAALAGCATGGGAEPAAPAVTTVEQTGEGSFAKAQTVTVSATVESVDQTTRMVTLRGPEGGRITFRAGDEVQNLAQVEKGDLVQATYHEAVAIQVRKPGEAMPGVSAGEAIERAEPGEKPAALGVQTVVLASTVAAIDPEGRSVTLEDVDGTQVTIPVRDPAHLNGVSVGDVVEITYTEALAIAVEEPGAK